MLKKRIAAMMLMAGSVLAAPGIGHAQEQTAPQAPAAQAPAMPQELSAPAGQQPMTATPTDIMPPDAPSTPNDNRPVAQQAPSALELPHNLSPWGMFMGADIVVKAVMIGLAFASLVTWTVWLAKSLELAAARHRARRALHVISKARTLADAGRALEARHDTGAALVHAARQEVELTQAALDHAGGDGLKERVGSRLSRIEAMAGRRMSRGTGVLATIGSTAPFVGLFGTVWGIMNSFIGISEAQTTNLAVVAPGIAEALLATALGLVAAIPAVVIYNVFARAITGYRQLLADASAGVERLVSRDLDFRSVRPRAVAAE
ncbi:outer membrane transport energization protein ExbB [Pseudaminobacter salicylatoxidans]|uniref:Biopolymer transport protein ExbB n=1 Tax=Pseudaminobacter salicylatoxidans TaxID=93369 RepID=A0A316CBJ7_PSESE|nr:tonB-system energizer ExbB [Pseudaminobacter salicylatoxidans]PWJ86466.1 outer membrane transport energization protein ExbB [Pseudaminobacter salicylatoxidans]